MGISLCEYLLALRLANKLADLRAANANLYPENRRFSEWVDPDGVVAKQKDTPCGCPFVLVSRSVVKSNSKIRAGDYPLDLT